MFTGIIEATGYIMELKLEGDNTDIWLSAPIVNELKVDQSVAHDGICLTVVEIKDNIYRVTAVKETLDKTNLGTWQIGKKVNLERSLRLGARLDGHFVQGHVDAVAKCTGKEEQNGSWLYRFSFPQQFASLVIEKGSVCLNGVSLTAFNVGRSEFSVAVIPYTYTHTNLQDIDNGLTVNIEFDVLGKYLLRQKELEAESIH